MNKRQAQATRPATANGIGCARLLIGSIGGLALLITLAALIGHGANDASACLRLTDPFLNVGMIDLHSGATIGLSVPPITRPREYQWVFGDTAQSSPDGRFAAYVGNILNPDTYTLNLRPAMTTNRYQSGRPLGTMSNGEMMGWYTWSPDSQWLAYIPRDSTSQQVTIVVSAAHADAQVSYAVKVAADEAISFYGWSADSNYLALSTAESDGVTYQMYVWSLPTLQLVASRTYARGLPGKYSSTLLFVDIAQWSPRGHTLAYLTQNAAVPGIVLMPLDSSDITYALPDNDFTNYDTIPPMFTWSPDSSHVAITGTGKQGYHVDLVSTDGSVPIALSDAVAKHNELYNNSPNDNLPITYWSADSQSLFYMNNSDDPANFYMSGDLLAYRLKTKHIDVLATNVFNDLQATPDHDYAFIAWALDDRLYTGVVRTADGKLLDAHLFEKFGVKLRIPDMDINWAVKDKWLLLRIPWTPIHDEPETWQVNVETGERRAVETWGTTSPDGRSVATMTTIPGSIGHITVDKLHIKNVEIIGARDITLNPEVDVAYSELSFIWSSNSKYIAVMYSTLRYDGENLQIVTLATGAIAEYHTSNFYPDKYSFGACH